ncbi:MAG: chitobiase/beta-hexosaminidase C-terminal domain-containing protein, partial [Clostridia bacterium]|nr:chitobiase/beta-hexosaminidase C-terminal domain-containing protein [Clostridia bacterium]
TGNIINTSCTNAMREVSVEYVKTYKMIDSMCRARASQMGDPDCKNDKKYKSNKTTPVRIVDGNPMPQNNDPSGIVYEGVIENPVSGAQVTLYYAADAYGNIVKEAASTDAETGKKTGTGNIEFGKTITALKAADDVRFLMPQEATEVTGDDGRFGWGVPEGLWFVRAEYAGRTGTSGGDAAATVAVSGVTLDGLNVNRLLPVLPVQLEVNIPIVDETAPLVEDVLYTSEGIYVTFTKYMEDTADDPTSVLNAANYTLSGESGDITGFGVEAAEQGHTPQNIAGEAVRTYTKTVCITPAAGTAFDGDVTLRVSGSVISYAGTPLGSEYSETGTTAAKEKLPAPVLSPASGEVERGGIVTVTAQEGATVYYTTDGSTPTVESRVCDGSVAVKGDMTVNAIAVKTGFEDSAVASGEYSIPSTLIRTVTVDVSSSDGSSVEGLVFTLRGTDSLGGTMDRDVKVLSGKLSMIGVPKGSYTLEFSGNDKFEQASREVKVEDNVSGISVTLTRKPVTGTEVIDPVKGDSFVYNYAKGKVTLSGGVTPATPVFIAVYDDGGRMLSCSIRTSPGIVDVSGGSKARLIWMSAAGFIAKVKCIEIDIK